MTWNAEDEARAALTWTPPAIADPITKGAGKGEAPHEGTWISDEAAHELLGSENFSKAMQAGTLYYVPNTGKKTAIGKAGADFYLVSDIPTEQDDVQP